MYMTDIFICYYSCNNISDPNCKIITLDMPYNKKMNRYFHFYRNWKECYLPILLDTTTMYYLYSINKHFN